jgi:heptosyltransferase-1
MKEEALRCPQRILIIRLSAIGDIVMASGVIPCLRDAFPKARIAWLTEEGNEDLLRHNPLLDQVFVWPRRRWRALRSNRHYRQWWSEFRRLQHDLNAQHFDWVLDLQGLLKSAVWGWLSGGQRRVGLGSKEGSQLLVTEIVDRDIDSPLIAKEYRKLMQVLGASPDRYALDIAVSQEVQGAARSLLTNVGVSGGYVVLAPFTTRPQKHWFDDRWVELAMAIRDSIGLTPVMVGSAAERDRAAAMTEHAGESVFNLCGQTRLDECAAVIRGSSLLVGVDTGLTHLGIAMRRPTLALFGSTLPYSDTGSDAARVLYHPLPCSPCHRRPTCGGAFTCMQLHSAEGILAAAQQLLHDAATSH